MHSLIAHTARRALAATFAVAGLLAPVASSAGQSVHFFVHAHEDDWQLFMGDQAYAARGDATQLTFIYTDAGDANLGEKSWTTRERAGQASMDQLIGGRGWWACDTQVVAAHPLRRCVRGKVVAYWMRLPDGGLSGEGFGDHGSMAALRDRQRPTLTAIDGSTTYKSWADLWQTIRGIIDTESAARGADVVTVHAPEWNRSTNIDDHPDHLATADAIKASAATRKWNVVWYIDYYTKHMPVNLTHAAFAIEQRLFYAYDEVMGAAGFGRNQYEQEYQDWLWRSYHRAESTSTSRSTTKAVPPVSSSRRTEGR